MSYLVKYQEINLIKKFDNHTITKLPITIMKTTNDNEFEEKNINEKIVNTPVSNNSLSLTKNDGNIRSYFLGGENFELDERFEALEILGSGAYGVVVSAIDHHSINQNIVAIKKCKSIFQNRTLAKRTLREIKLLRLCCHNNIVRINTVLIPNNQFKFKEIYVVFEMMETDLSQIIRSPQILKDQHVQYFSFQLIDALNYLHSHNIVHRDLKPRNLLVNCNCLLKIADFGLARVYNDRNDTKIVAMTEYVTTRWYRAPEILVGYHKYTSAVDMWAVGCIINEMISRHPMFPGSSSKKQLDAIIKIMGTPPKSFSTKSRKTSYRQYLMQIQNIEPKHFPTLYPSASPESLDLIQKFLVYDPDERYTAKDALNHIFMRNVKINYDDAVESSFYCNPNEFAFEDKENTIESLRQDILSEIWVLNNIRKSTDSCHIVTPESAELKDELPPISSSKSMEIFEADVKDTSIRSANIIEGENKKTKQKKGIKTDQEVLPTSGCILC